MFNTYMYIYVYIYIKFRTDKKKSDINWPIGQWLFVTKFPDLSLLLDSRIYWLEDHIYLRKGISIWQQ